MSDIPDMIYGPDNTVCNLFHAITAILVCVMMSAKASEIAWHMRSSYRPLDNDYLRKIDVETGWPITHFFSKIFFWLPEQMKKLVFRFQVLMLILIILAFFSRKGVIGVLLGSTIFIAMWIQMIRILVDQVKYGSSVYLTDVTRSNPLFKTKQVFKSKNPLKEFLFLFLGCCLIVVLGYAGIYNILYINDLDAFVGIGRNGDSDFRFVDFIYFSITTLATVGYGDIHPSSSYWAKFLVGSEIATSFLIVVVLVSSVSLTYNAKSTLRLLLKPRLKPVYGQDYLSFETCQACSLTEWHNIPNRGYVVPSHNPDLIVTHNVEKISDCEFILAQEKTVRVVAHLHCQPEYLGGEAVETIRIATTRINKWIVPSDFLRQKLRDVTDNSNLEIYTVWNGGDPSRFSVASDIEVERWRFGQGLETGKVLVGYVGRPTITKGINIAKIFKIAMPSKMQMLFQVPSNDVEELNEIISDLSLGSIYPDVSRDAPRPIRFCDALLMPSLSEVCPMTVIEALLCGVPVFATDSTPFYEELLIAWPDAPLKIVPLPDYCKGRSHDELFIVEEDAKRIAKEFIKLMMNFKYPNEIQRRDFSERAIKAGLSVNQMTRKWIEIYQMPS